MQTRTFLFADLREYTKFVEHHGDAAAATLIGDYRRLVRAEVARHEGAEVKTEGDSFYVVFNSAQAAIRCGIGILREADRYSAERLDRPIKVGVGIHAGEPQPHEGQFVGGAVIVAARLAQQASAGELLVTEIARGLLPGGAVPIMTEREGLSLKGIAQTPRVFTVEWRAASVPAEAPVVTSVPATPPEDGIIAARQLIGRETELAALMAFFDEASRGKGRLVVVAGEAGLGKSALLRHFLEAIRDRAGVLMGECLEIEARRPFGPLVEAFEASGLPSPREFRGVGPGALGPAEIDRYRIHAAFISQLRERAATGPVVLVLEDVHWADEATLELVQLLPRRIQTAAILVVATYRSDELHRRHPLNDTLAELDRGRLSSEIRLRPLDEDGSARLIASALGLERAPTTEFRQAIHERCDGNPFFTEEVLRALVQKGDLAYADGSWRRTRAVAQLELPRTILAAVDQRLRQLSETALSILRIAAVIGTRFDFDLLRQVTGLDEEAILAALREAVDAQLVVEERDERREVYRFRHALTREAVMSELLARERRSLHRRIAAALESAPGPTDRHAESLAYHFDEAGDVDKTIEHRRRAADQALRTVAFARAKEHLDRVVEIAAADYPDLPDLYLELARASAFARQLPQALTAAEAARSIARDRADPRREGRALSQLAALLMGLGDRGRAVQHADDAIEVLEPLGQTRDLAWAYARRAYIALLDHDERVVELADRAADLARNTGDMEALSRALNYAGSGRAADRQISDPAFAEGVRLLRQSFGVAREHDLIEAASTALNNLEVVMIRGGCSRTEYQSVVLERLSFARSFGLREGTIFDDEIEIALQDGDWDTALRVIEEGRGAGTDAAARSLREAFIRVARNGPPPSWREVQEAHDRLLASGIIQSMSAGLASAYVRYVAGDLRGAIEDARPVQALPKDQTTMWRPLIAAMLAADELGDAEARSNYIDRALSGSRRNQVRYLTAVYCGEALQAEDSDDRSAAIAKYEEAARIATEWADWIPLTFVILRRARLLSAAGDPLAARKEFDRFLPYWRRAKATWYLGELEKKARAMGIELVAAGG